MTPEWVLAICALATLIGGMAVAWAYVVSGLRILKIQVDSLDREIVRIVRQQARLEDLILTLLGKNPRLPESDNGESRG